MIIKGKQLSTENNTIYKDTQHIIIHGVEQDKKYYILYNNKTYTPNISDTNIIFTIPEILDKNIISLKIHNVNDQFLYNTNSIELIGKEREIQIAEDKTKQFQNKLEKFEDRYYSNMESILAKQASFDFSIQQIKKQISELKQYDDTEINNKISLLITSVEKLENQKPLNYDNEISKIQSDISKLAEQGQKFNLLDSEIKNLQSNLLKLEQKPIDFTEVYTKIESIQENLLRLQSEKLSQNQKIIGIQSALEEELNSAIMELHSKLSEISYDGEIATIKNQIDNLDYYNREYIDELVISIKARIDEVTDKFSENYFSLMGEVNKGNDLINNINTKVNSIDKDLQDTKEHWRIDGEDLYNQNVALQKSYDKLQEEHKMSHEKMSKLEDSHRTLYNAIQQEIANSRVFILSINKNAKIEPYRALQGDCDKPSHYAYKNGTMPFGISDNKGNVIIKGIAKCEYVGDVKLGSFIMPNKNGIFEPHTTGYIVTAILDKNFCEVLL